MFELYKILLFSFDNNLCTNWYAPIAEENQPFAKIVYHQSHDIIIRIYATFSWLAQHFWDVYINSCAHWLWFLFKCLAFVFLDVIAGPRATLSRIGNVYTNCVWLCYFSQSSGNIDQTEKRNTRSTTRHAYRYKRERTK